MVIGAADSYTECSKEAAYQNCSGEVETIFQLQTSNLYINLYNYHSTNVEFGNQEGRDLKKKLILIVL